MQVLRKNVTLGWLTEAKTLAALLIFPNTFHIPQGMLWLWKQDYICALTAQVLKKLQCARRVTTYLEEWKWEKYLAS